MGFSSEMAIEMHNEAMATDAEYAENYYRQTAKEEAAYFEWELENERESDWFDDYRLAHDGFEETDEQIFEPSLISDEIPF